jgi:hypothetical protein
VQEHFGVLHDRRAVAAKLVTTSTFTSEAVAFAQGKPMQLVPGNELVQLIRSVQRSNRGGKLATAQAGLQDQSSGVARTSGIPAVAEHAKLVNWRLQVSIDGCRLRRGTERGMGEFEAEKSRHGMGHG